MGVISYMPRIVIGAFANPLANLNQTLNFANFLTNGRGGENPMPEIDTTPQICKSGTLAVPDTGSPVVLKILIFIYALWVHSRRALNCTANSSPAVQAGPETARPLRASLFRLANPNPELEWLPAQTRSGTTKKRGPKSKPVRL